MIRLIMAMIGGPADGVGTIEYPNWAQVESVASEIATLAGTTTPINHPNWNGLRFFVAAICAIFADAIGIPCTHSQ